MFLKETVVGDTCASTLDWPTGTTDASPLQLPSSFSIVLKAASGVKPSPAKAVELSNSAEADSETDSAAIFNFFIEKAELLLIEFPAGTGKNDDGIDIVEGLWIFWPIADNTAFDTQTAFVKSV